jgi:hypothetical protein
MDYGEEGLVRVGHTQPGWDGSTARRACEHRSTGNGEMGSPKRNQNEAHKSLRVCVYRQEVETLFFFKKRGLNQPLHRLMHSFYSFISTNEVRVSRVV